ncbi:MAG: aldehyde reductase [Pedobacter sp.]|uniref:SDR family oxidoreductase n=1 Tax=Pedobacter sp. TaxID=1411316 RepID=UPI00339B5BA5
MDTNKKLVLVTGGSGFLGTHTIAELLKNGYPVKTTIRSLNRKEEVLANLRTAGITDLQKLSFVEADLTADTNWADAVAGCTYVLHVASPFPAKQPKDENELIIPARDGVLRILKAANNGGVKRVVMTSSFAAIGYSTDPKNHVFTESDWTDENAPIEPYIKSKTIAEKAAWKYIKDSGSTMEFSVVNPVGIFGPAVGSAYSASIDLIVNIMNGTVKENRAFSFGVVDVRDVAEMHLLVMESPIANAERFIATADGVMTFFDIASLIKRERSALASDIADLKAGNPADKITISNRKAKDMLGWHPRTKEEAILASVDYLKDQKQN